MEPVPKSRLGLHKLGRSLLSCSQDSPNPSRVICRTRQMTRKIRHLDEQTADMPQVAEIGLALCDMEDVARVEGNHVTGNWHRREPVESSVS